MIYIPIFITLKQTLPYMHYAIQDIKNFLLCIMVNYINNSFIKCKGKIIANFMGEVKIPVLLENYCIFSIMTKYLYDTNKIFHKCFTIQADNMIFLLELYVSILRKSFSFAYIFSLYNCSC